jgi:hypothetical protein
VKFDTIKLIESAFGKFPAIAAKFDGKHARCRCGRRFRKIDPVELVKVDAEAEPFNSLAFCSLECSRLVTATTPETRQARRQQMRLRARKQIAMTMGFGPKASNPRRNRRVAALNLAANLYRARFA